MVAIEPVTTSSLRDLQSRMWPEPEPGRLYVRRCRGVWPALISPSEHADLRPCPCGWWEVLEADGHQVSTAKTMTEALAEARSFLAGRRTPAYGSTAPSPPDLGVSEAATESLTGIPTADPISGGYLSDCPQWRCPHVSVHDRREGATCLVCDPCDCALTAEGCSCARPLPVGEWPRACAVHGWQGTPVPVVYVPQGGCPECGAEAPGGCRITKHHPDGMHTAEPWPTVHYRPRWWARLWEWMRP